MGNPVTVTIWGKHYGSLEEYSYLEVYRGDSTLAGLYHFLKTLAKGEKRPVQLKVCRL